MSAVLPAGAQAAPATSSPLVATNPAIATGVQNYNGTQSNTGQGSATSTNQYTPGQQALQGQAGTSLLNFLSSGSVPGNLTAPPQVLNAYNQDFQNYVEPGIAAQFGAGSPQIAGQQNMGMVNLLAQLYQNGVGNYMQGEGLAGSLGYIPVGANATSATSGQANVNANQAQGTPLLSSLLSLLGIQ